MQKHEGTLATAHTSDALSDYFIYLLYVIDYFAPMNGPIVTRLSK